jgi:ribonuclease HI
MEIKVFTDGSCNMKQKKCGYGIYFPDKQIKDISEKFTNKPLTNQRAELYAIYMALLKTTKIKANKIKIYSDSMYSINCATNWINKWKTNGWLTANKKPVKNLDIIKPIDDIITKYKGKIEFIHVPSHTKGKDELSIGNDKADKLAVAGSNK